MVTHTYEEARERFESIIASDKVPAFVDYVRATLADHSHFRRFFKETSQEVRDAIESEAFLREHYNDPLFYMTGTVDTYLFKK